jgi:uncharacterized protein YlxP (DUF503 family)
MVVGVCQVVLALYDNQSLKGKRSAVRKVIHRTRNRFNIAIAEVSDNDVHEHAVVGFAIVGNDRRFVNSRLDKILEFIDGIGIAPIADHEFEIVSY